MENETNPTEVIEEILPGAESPVADVSSDFDDFLDEGDGDSSPKSDEGPGEVAATPDSGAGIQPGVVPPGAPVVPAPPATPQVPVVAPVADVAPAAPAAPSVAQPQAPQAVATPGLSDAQLRENLIAEISTRYVMPDAVKDQFMLEPEKVLPTMAARIVVDAYDAIFNAVMAQIPQMMGQREQARETQRTVEDKFFTRWPGLKDPAFKNDLESVGRTYRAQNPRATLEQSIEAVGAMVSVIKGVPLPGQTVAQAHLTPRVPPPVPAGVGASRAPVAQAVQQNIFDVFTDEDI